MENKEDISIKNNNDDQINQDISYIDTSKDEEILENDINTYDNDKEEDNKKNNQLTYKAQSIVTMLCSTGKIIKSQLNAAKIQAEKTKKSVLQCLIEMDFITEEEVQEIINKNSGNTEEEIKKKTLLNIDINTKLLSRVPISFIKYNKILPLKEENGTIIVAGVNKYDIILIDKLSTFFGNKPVKIIQYSTTDILEAIDKQCNSSNIDDLSDIMSQKNSILDIAGEESLNESEVVKFIDTLIKEAIRMRASDIHIEPEEYFVRIRYRIDGILFQKTIVHKNYWSAICVRLKVLSGMNIAESRRPQDAAITMEINERKVDFRVSSIPTIYGENFVLRILDKQQNLTELSTLGYSEHNLNLIKLAIQKPEGITIATGPTGSGKTTTLYSILSKINTIEKNIMTLEDPVEYRMNLLRQSEMNDKIGFNFAAGLRSLLRQDPDIIFLGEIRDQETAENAIRASITGHQVFSTLHTNCAIAAINRLIDMGIPPYMLSGNLNAVISQRLVRMLCPNCKQEIPLSETIKTAFGLDKDKYYAQYKPVGCSKCNNIGYKGRSAVSEVLFVNDNMNMVIAENPTLKQATDAALQEGFIPIAQDCIEKLIKGYTSWSDICRVVDMTKYIQNFNGETL